MNAPDWLRRELAHGLQALLALRLKNAPAEDMVELTADIWLQAFTRRMGIAVEELDAPRIAEGFRRLFPVAREWPAPADVLGMMPGRPPQKRLPAPVPTEAEHRENVVKVKQMVDELINRLYMPQEDKTC
jgi:hypothetical protein